MAPTKDTSSSKPSRENTSDEVEVKKAKWMKRTLSRTLSGRIVMSSYETLRSSGTTTVCLSPWGDSSPLVLPCIRFRDLAVHAIDITGGVALVASPVMDHLGDLVESVFSNSNLADILVNVGESFMDDKMQEVDLMRWADGLIPINSSVLRTEDIKMLTITLKYKHSMVDASLGYFRSSLHGNQSLFSNIKERLNVYWTIEKGWFSPYLFASNRRPLIPRPMKPDIVFSWGPFLSGDYSVGLQILQATPKVFTFCRTSDPWHDPSKDKKGFFTTIKRLWNTDEDEDSDEDEKGVDGKEAVQDYHLPSDFTDDDKPLAENHETHAVHESAHETGPKRRLMISVIGIKPARTRSMWSHSKRPGESVIKYVIMDGCPAIVIPIHEGCPLIAWHTMTLQRLYEVGVEELEGTYDATSARARQFTLDADARSGLSTLGVPEEAKAVKWWRKTIAEDEADQERILDATTVLEEEPEQIIEVTERVEVPIIDQAVPRPSKNSDEEKKTHGNFLDKISSLPSTPIGSIDKKLGKVMFGRKSKDSSNGDGTNTSAPATPASPESSHPHSAKLRSELKEQMGLGKKWISKKSKSVTESVNSSVASLNASRQNSAAATPTEHLTSFSRKSSVDSHTAEISLTSQLVQSPKSSAQDLATDYFSTGNGATDKEKLGSQSSLGTPASPFDEAGHRAKQWLNRKLSQLSNSSERQHEDEKQLTPLEKVEEVLFEFLSLHVDWERMELPNSPEPATSSNATISEHPSEMTHPAGETTFEKIVQQSADEQATASSAAPNGAELNHPTVPSMPTTLDEKKRKMLRAAVGAMVAAAVRTQESAIVEKNVDIQRAGIVMFRIP